MDDGTMQSRPVSLRPQYMSKHEKTHIMVQVSGSH